MKPYGKFRRPNIDGDVAPKSTVRNMPGRGGDIHNSLRSVTKKARARRIWKRVAREVGKAECRTDDTE